MENIISMIGNYGFPIVICLLLCYYVKYINDKMTDTINTLEQSHLNEIKILTETIERNTQAVTILNERLNNNVSMDNRE